MKIKQISSIISVSACLAFTAPLFSLDLALVQLHENQLKDQDSFTLNIDNLDLDNFQALLEALKNNKSVKKLIVKKTGTEIDKEKEELLAQFLKSIATNDSLEILDLGNLKLGGETIVELAYSLKDNKILNELILQGNIIGDWEVTEIAYALKYNKSLKNLDLSNNKITKFGLQLLLNALKINKTLHHIDIRDNLGQSLDSKAFILLFRELNKQVVINRELLKNRQAILPLLGSKTPESAFAELPKDILTKILLTLVDIEKAS